MVSDQEPESPASTPEEAVGPRTETLFVIRRSKNANVVHYDAQLTAEGDLDPNSPLKKCLSMYYAISVGIRRSSQL